MVMPPLSFDLVLIFSLGDSSQFTTWSKPWPLFFFGASFLSLESEEGDTFSHSLLSLFLSYHVLYRDRAQFTASVHDREHLNASVNSERCVEMHHFTYEIHDLPLQFTVLDTVNSLGASNLWNFADRLKVHGFWLQFTALADRGLQGETVILA
ncbi:unnamed protein product [Linum trigynum]|uniref:Uncharacterized protein n=1 Tax=Linum trigynum TaxID=586398 RepID=A0AAV2DY10_9ROSI